MESQPQNPEFRNNPENFHPCIGIMSLSMSLSVVLAASHFWFLINNIRRDVSISFKIYRRVKHCKIQVNFEFGDHLQNSD